ncbi:MAG: secondary thiamine-phosphate synthase enzyme YjbQ [Candidatus Odinarchaeum yellowstonii]|uniref:Secondary thiamine-phosphate synthase enzyme YjbQ n=1 Tax=Odinarchaeota yellowstonii (strain LCB_4) TaxID=1841599 RepID=A0AAF0IB29_ODILC|nr:MAG: secondary thiamine-phosphate synthase enzyme YjbQ [Candidatus Odinarchaeum yellowstonii]
MNLRILSKSFNIASKSRVEVINITYQVRDIISQEDLKNGLVNVFVKHTTCGLIINESEKGLISDIMSFLSKIVPYKAGYAHDRIDDNADAHLKSILTGNSVTVPILNGELGLGTWQSILLLELDGPRERTVNLTFLVD